MSHGKKTVRPLIGSGLLALIGAAACTFGPASAVAQSVEQFYKGKTMTLVVSVIGGEGFDINGRLVARYLSKYLPGHPTFVPKNMPGAGHVIAANYMFTEAPKDGSTIGTISPSIITHQLLDGRGARFDITRFKWLGVSDSGNQAVYAWAASGFKTLEDAMNREALAGSTGAGSYTMLYPTLMNNLLGTKFKIIAGYKTTKEIDLAMQRGEVEVRAGQSLVSLKLLNGEWLRDTKINILAQIGRQRDAEFPDVPVLTEYAKSDDVRRILELFEVQLAVARPFLAPPDIPADRLAALRQAFDQTMTDPDFLAEAGKAGLDIHPLDGATVTDIIRKVAATPPELIAMAKRAKGDTEIAR
jgi:tripartite-type tricarboxylate transporter receptor subunit TctC